jgi:hypothetical protein
LTVDGLGGYLTALKPTMKTAIVLSPCECQTQLGAELDEHKHVVRGWAKEPRRKQTESAPAHSIHAEREQFQVGWLCPFCTRNTLRSFDTAGLVFREAQPATAAR